MSDAIPSGGPIKLSPEIKFLGACLLYAPVEDCQSPEQAFEAAENLARLFEQYGGADLDAWAHRNVRIAKSWADGVKYLPGESRLGRAKAKFENLLKRARISDLPNRVLHSKLHLFIHVGRGLGDWQKEGFTTNELEILKGNFDRFGKNLLAAAKTRKRAPATKKSSKAT